MDGLVGKSSPEQKCKGSRQSLGYALGRRRANQVGRAVVAQEGDKNWAAE